MKDIANNPPAGARMRPDVHATVLLTAAAVVSVFASVFSSVRPEEEGQASGANNAIRELGGVFGVAVLAAVFSGYGGYGSGQHFVDGLVPAVFIGAIVVAVGSLAAFAIGKRRSATVAEAVPA